jgi:hypothetical protein
MGGGGLAGLVRNAQVRDELKLSDEQLGALTRMGEELNEQRREMFSGMGNFRDLSESEREARMEEMRKKGEELEKKVEKQLSEVLNREQFQRLKQIELQQQGTRALLREDIIQALGITEKQQQQLQSAAEEAREKMMAMFREGREGERGDREGMRERMQQLRQESDKAAMAVLTDEQKAKLKDIMGKPFEMEEPQFGRGFGGRRGGEGGAGGRRGDQGGEGARPGRNRPRRPEA